MLAHRKSWNLCTQICVPSATRDSRQSKLLLRFSLPPTNSYQANLGNLHWLSKKGKKKRSSILWKPTLLAFQIKSTPNDERRTERSLRNDFTWVIHDSWNKVDWCWLIGRSLVLLIGNQHSKRWTTFALLSFCLAGQIQCLTTLSFVFRGRREIH